MIFFRLVYVDFEIIDAKFLQFLTGQPIKIVLVVRLSKVIQEKVVSSLISKAGEVGIPIVVNFDLKPSNENLLWLVRTSFKPFYDFDPKSIVVFSEQEKAVHITNYLLAQGFDRVKVIDKSVLMTISIGSIEGYMEPLNSIEDNFIYISRFSPKTDSAWDALRFLVGEKLSTTNILNSLIEKAKILESEKEELAYELENQKVYLNIALKQKEAENILLFYHKEYEVLPLWYKRFGHIIKAVLGKRSFRSLFFNGTKKYNN